MNRTSERMAQRLDAGARPISYLDCLLARVPVPQDSARKSIFQILMVSGMVSIMVTFNGLMHAGPAFFVTSHWLYPLALCLALALRVLLVNRIAARVTAQRPFTALQGFARSLAVTGFNVLVMATIMTCVISLLLNGTDGLAPYLARSIPVSVLTAFAVNVLIVAPFIKFMYYRVLSPAAKARIVAFLQRNPTGWAGIFTN